MAAKDATSCLSLDLEDIHACFLYIENKSTKILEAENNKSSVQRIEAATFSKFEGNRSFGASRQPKGTQRSGKSRSKPSKSPHLNRSAPPDVCSLEDFPPIVASPSVPHESYKPQKVHALAGRQSRRITPTSLVTPQSGSVWTSGHSHGWADNPAFISPIPTSNSWKAQSEDRQLLHEQLRKQKRTNPSRPHHSGDPTSSRPHHSGDPTSSRPHHSGDPTSSRPHHSGDPTSSRPHHSGDPTSSRPHHSGDPTSSRPHHSGDSTSSRPHHSGDPTSSRPHHSGDPTSSRPHHSGDKQIIRGAQNCAEPPEGGPVKVVTGGVTNITAGGVADVPEEGMLLEEATLSEDDKKDIKEFAWGYSALLRGVAVNVVPEVLRIIQLISFKGTVISSGGNEGLQKHVRMLGTRDKRSYFAVQVLECLKEFLAVFSKETLQLLSNCQQLGHFSAEMRDCLERQIQLDEPDMDESTSPKQSSFRVLFNAKTDSKQNFSDDKTFHSFKKQRDGFYEFYRLWRSHSNDLEWFMDSKEMVEKIRYIVSLSTDCLTREHFAMLFQQQLLESCRSGPAASLDGSLYEKFKQEDPRKLSKLKERFTVPFQRQTSIQQNQQINTSEEFFNEFVILADSYSFNEHLKICLVREIVKLTKDGLLSTALLEYEAVHRDLLILARLLGIVVYQPYKGLHGNLPQHSNVNYILTHSVDILSCLRDALRACHLILTVPWIVEYLGKLRLPQQQWRNESLGLLSTLFNILKVVSQLQELPFRNRYLIQLSLAHLLEVHGIWSLYNEYCAQDQGVDPIVKEWVDTLKLDQENLDTKEFVRPKTILCTCPTLGEIHSALVGLNAGQAIKPNTMRKIKPIPVYSNQLLSVQPKNNMEKRLEDAFFKGQPAYLKQLCDIMVTRLASNLESICRDEIIPGVVVSGMQELANWIRRKIQESEDEEDSEQRCVDFLSQPEVAAFLSSVKSQCVSQGCTLVANHTERYLQETSHKTLEALCFPELTKPVIDACCKICIHRTKTKLYQWAQGNVITAIQETIQQNFGKMKRLLAMKSNKFKINIPMSLLKACAYRDNSIAKSHEQSGYHGDHTKGSQLNVTHASSPLNASTQIVSRPTSSPLVVGRPSHLSTSQLSGKVFLSPVTPKSITQVSNKPDPLSFHECCDSIQGLNCASVLEYLKKNLHNMDSEPESCDGFSEKEHILLSLLCQLLLSLHEDTTINGLVLPMLLDSCLASNVAETSIDLAVKMVERGATTNCTEVDYKDVLIELWKLLKACKTDIPWQRMLATEIISSLSKKCDITIPQKQLASLFVKMSHNEIASSAELEGLFLAHLKTDSSEGLEWYQKLAVQFLDLFYSYSLVTCDEKATGDNSESNGRSNFIQSQPKIHYRRLINYFLVLDLNLLPVNLQKFGFVLHH